VHASDGGYEAPASEIASRSESEPMKASLLTKWERPISRTCRSQHEQGRRRRVHLFGSPGFVGQRVIKDGVGTWEALLAGFVTLSGVGRHNRVVGQ